MTSLHVAADHGDECMVDCLLAIGTGPNAMDDVNSLICHSSILMDTYLYMAVDEAIVTSKYQIAVSHCMPSLFCWPGVLREATD